jgi:hypothetical protein
MVLLGNIEYDGLNNQLRTGEKSRSLMCGSVLPKRFISKSLVVLGNISPDLLFLESVPSDTGRTSTPVIGSAAQTAAIAL